MKMMHVKPKTILFPIRVDLAWPMITSTLNKTGDLYFTSIMANRNDLMQKNYVRMMVLIYHFRDFTKKINFIELISRMKEYGLMLKMILMRDSKL